MSTRKDKAKPPKKAPGARRKAPAKASAARKKPASAARTATPTSAARQPTARKAKAKVAPAFGKARRKAAAKAPPPAPEAAPEAAPEIVLSEAATAPADDGPARRAAVPGDAPGAPDKESLIERSFKPFALRHEHRPAAAAAPDDGETDQRQSKLVPTNAVHTTKRRLRRGSWQNRAIAVAALGMLAGLVILTERSAPTDPSPFERQAALPAGPAGPHTGALPAVPDSSRLRQKLARGDTVMPNRAIIDPVQADPGRATGVGFAQPAPPRARQLASMAEATDAPHGGGSPAPALVEVDLGPVANPADMGGLSPLELVEMEHILARLDLGTSEPDGVIDAETENAIRSYQEISGLPVDGEPSRVLLHDMREVAKILDSGG